jgi:hypothetical protein
MSRRSSYQPHELADLALEHLIRLIARRSGPGAEPHRPHRVADRRERVSQLVRQHRQELGLASVRLGKIRRQRPQVVRQAFPLGHVLADRRVRHRPPVGVGQRQDLVSHPARLAGLEVPEADLDLAVAVLQDRRKEFVGDPVLILGEEERRHGLPAGLVQIGEPDHLQPGAVDEERNALEIAYADEVSAGLDQRDELLAVRLDLPLAGHVAHDLGRAHHVPVVVLDRGDRERDPHTVAVAPHTLGHEVVDPPARL